ncbi:phospholipase A2 [Litorilituus sediminis]|uniref:Uncharacterized protein n=1 Tax=Litorilituus sediminis TaxID=718192 RepID=A0A4P6PA27_9GAMM|nr:phospholipase A2 [Litorilituus sediminis]QBG36407.1 hypothetical protein EMK97_12105 [Litorilituus sediminis]
MDKQPKDCQGTIDLSPNGCSSGGAGGMWDSVFISACNGHDLCYTTVNSDKGACDLNFQVDMQAICLSDYSHPTDQTVCMNFANEYYSMVDLVPASLFYEPAQADVKCVIWQELEAKVC